MSLPIYQVDDIVYLIESANVGFIESYRITGVRQDSAGWWYNISVEARAPVGGQTYGDRITLRRDLDFELQEASLCDYCTAVGRALAAARAQVARLEALYAAQCEDSGGSV